MLWLLTNLLIRSALILGAALLLWRMLSRSRAAQRHAVVFSAFGLLFLWPILAALLPEVALPLAQSGAATGTVTVQQFVLTRRAAAATHSFIYWPALLWAAAACLAFLPLVVAHLRLRPILRRAAPISDADWLTLLHSLTAQLGLTQVPLILIHPEPIMPMTFGLWRPRIVLPGDCHLWTPSRRGIVLLHELAHIKRRDLAMQCFARLIAAGWWFQPLCWSALRLLRRESERACDALVLASGVRPSEYAAELLAIAQSFSARPSLSAAAIAMAREGDLAGRLRAIVEPQRRPSARAGFAAVASLTALTITVSAVTLLPESKPQSLRGHSMKHTLFAGLLASAGLSAATIGGSLYDPSGAAVPNANALLYDPDTNAKFETTTSPEGKFVFETLPAGQYILRVQKPGFATLFREFNVKPDAKVDRGFTLALGAVHEQLTVTASGTPAPASAQKAAQPLRVGGNVEQTKLTRKVQPKYPLAAKAAGIQGTVSLEMVISKEGEPLDIRVVSSPDDNLTQSALEAVRQWRYEATLLNGNPVEVITDVVVNYTLAP
jgi:TonB family protein